MKGRDDSLMRLGWIDINPIRMHHKDMRTTLTIDDDVLKEAVKRAEALSISWAKPYRTWRGEACRWRLRSRRLAGWLFSTRPRTRPGLRIAA